jgi:hypothetical protein
VEGRWGKTEAESPWQRLKWGLVLGGEQFADAARQQLKPSRETLGRRLLRARMSWEQIVAHVENLRGESWTTMRDRHGDTGRELAWWAGRTYAGLTLRELGERAGGVDYTAVAMALRRFNAKVQRNRKLAAAQQSLAAKCEM